MGVDANKQQAFTDLVKYLALEDYLAGGCDSGLCPREPLLANDPCTESVPIDTAYFNSTTDRPRILGSRPRY